MPPQVTVMVLNDHLNGLHISARIIGLPTFLSGDNLRCEVTVHYYQLPLSQAKNNTNQPACSISQLSGLLVGQFRLSASNLPPRCFPPKLTSAWLEQLAEKSKYFARNELFHDGLDPNSQVCWSTSMSCNSSLQNLSLEPGTSSTFVLKGRLPKNLPPSYRGSVIRVAYKALICVQTTDAISQHRLIHIPFRLLPSLNAYSMVDSNTSLPKSSISSTASSTIVNDGQEDNANPFRLSTNGDSGDERFNYFGDGELLFREKPHPVIFDRLSQLFVASSVGVGENKLKGERPKKKKRIRNKSTTRSPSTLFAELVSSSSIATFVISGPNGHICRVGLFKTAARLGDTIRGYLDFRAASLPCFACTVRAETFELVNLTIDDEVSPTSSTLAPIPDDRLPFFTLPVDIIYRNHGKVSKHPKDSKRTTWSEKKLVCANVKFLPFSLSIPLNAPPEFLLKGLFSQGSLQLCWDLQFVFEVSTIRPKTRTRSVSESSLFDQFIRSTTPTGQNKLANMPMTYGLHNTFPWELPVSILPNGPAAFVFPCESKCNALIITNS